MKNRKKAFTLTELLIALGIIGAIAAISIPSLMTTINNRILANQLKSTVGAIQQLANDQMVVRNTKALTDTDFSNPTQLLTTSNFEVVKTCTASNAAQNCWKTGGSVATTDKITYKYLNGSNMGAKNLQTIITKNGSIISYSLASGAITGSITDKLIGRFDIDVNGNEGPNIIGRDYFAFYITNKGRIVDMYYNSTNTTLETKKTACKTAARACFGAVVDAGWKIDY